MVPKPSNKRQNPKTEGKHRQIDKKTRTETYKRCSFSLLTLWKMIGWFVMCTADDQWTSQKNQPDALSCSILIQLSSGVVYKSSFPSPNKIPNSEFSILIKLEAFQTHVG